MIDVATLAVWALATHRLFLFYFEHPTLGPVRGFLARRHEKLGYCHLCLSTWIPAAVIGLWFVPYAGWLVVSVLALSEAIGLIDGAHKAMARVGTMQVVADAPNGTPAPHREEART